MDRVNVGVEESFVALIAGEWILPRVLLDLMLLQLQLSSEPLFALTAGMRKKLNVMSIVMSSHVALVGEHLLAALLNTLECSNFRLRFMNRLLVAVQVGSVCVRFTTSFNTAAK